MRSLLLLGLLLVLLPGPARAGDADHDGVDDLVDSCPHSHNPRVVPPLPGQTTLGGQPDDDLDGIGNACDCDFDGDGFCNIDDFAPFLMDLIAGFPTPGRGTDMNGDGFVNINDFNRFLPGFLAGAPGPTCGEACDGRQLGCAGPGCPAGPNPACADAAVALCQDQDFLAADGHLAACLDGLNVDDPGVPPAGSALGFGAASAFRGWTRALRPLLEQPGDGDPASVDRISEVLDALGFPAEGRDPFAWTALRGLGPAGLFPADTCIAPEGALDASDFQAAVETDVLPALDRALAELEATALLAPAWNGACEVPLELGGFATLEFDDTDALALRASLHFARGLLRLLLAWNAEAGLEEACQTIRLGPLGGIERLLADHPDLLTFRDPAMAALPALEDWRAAVALAEAALDAALAETDLQDDDFLSVVFDTPEDEQALRARLARLGDTLLGPTQFPRLGLCGSPDLYAGAFFEAAPRGLLPAFDGNHARYDTFPDPTFGGVVTPFDTDALLCSFEHEPPLVTVTTVSGLPGGFDTLDLVVHVEDGPAGNASGVDPSSVQIEVGSPTCAFTLNGQPSNGTYLYPAEDHFVGETGPDGSLTLSATAAPTPAGPCDFWVYAAAGDANGNGSFALEPFQVRTTDLMVFYEPGDGGYASHPPPLPVEITLWSRDPATWDPDLRPVAFEALGCNLPTIDGAPAAAGFASVFMTEDGDPSDAVRALTGTLDAQPGGAFCEFEFCATLFESGGAPTAACQVWELLP